MHCLFVYLRIPCLSVLSVWRRYGPRTWKLLWKKDMRLAARERSESSTKARRKLGWRPSERTDAGACAGVPTAFRLEQQSSRGWPIRTCVFIFMSF